ncbi:MAG: TolC family protein [Bacteroidales bacterium]|jgi:outer membrane protein|nr:TolC family protein [Bacteroidales bacterium]NLB02622.1 TolC family protein [Bacteroidales bacterium]
MKKTIISLLCLILLATFGLQAQKVWTLKECIEHALAHNIAIKTAGLNAEAQEIQQKNSQYQRLPYVSASASHNFGFGQTQDNTGVYVNNNSQSTSAGISSGITIFNGFQINNNIKAQQFSSLASLENLNKAKEDLSLNIASAYLQILYNKELYQLALEQVSLSKEQLRQYEIRYAHDKIPEGQLFEIRARLAQDELSATQQKQTMELSLLELSQLLELEDWKDFDVSEPDSQSLLNKEALQLPAESIYDQAQSNRAAIKSAQYEVMTSEKMLEVSRGARYPTLSLGASYSNSYYDHSGYVNPSLKDQLSSNGRSNIGLSLSVPIFNRLSTSNNIKRSNINLETARLQLENTKKMLYKEIQQAWFNAMTAEEKYQASFETIRATEEAFRFTEEKFNNGRSTMYEYNEARMQLLKTRSEQVQAKYNLMFSLKILDFYRGNSISL